MPGVTTAGVLPQEARLLPELRRAAHGRECAASGGGDVRPAPGAAMGAECPGPVGLANHWREHSNNPEQALRFLFASKPEAIGPVLGIVHRVIAGWLADQAGVERSTAQCGAVTLIQRFGSALNLTNSRQANLCAKREVARAVDAIRAR